jgi:hypothetical protein
VQAPARISAIIDVSVRINVFIDGTCISVGLDRVPQVGSWQAFRLALRRFSAKK